MNSQEAYETVSKMQYLTHNGNSSDFQSRCDFLPMCEALIKAPTLNNIFDDPSQKLHVMHPFNEKS